jgi:hypothetical protein
MKVKISEILKQQGLFSNDIKTRIKNKQIFINGESISDDLEFDCSIIKNVNKDVTGVEFGNDIVEVFDAGDFVFDLVSNRKWLARIQVFGIENLFDTNIENDLTLFLKKFIFVKISKKQIFVIKKTNIDEETNFSN